MDVPGELFGDHVDVEGRTPIRKLDFRMAPDRKRERRQQNDLRDGYRHLQISRRFEMFDVILGLVAGTAAKPENTVEKEKKPADEQHDHDNMDDDDETVDLPAISGNVDRQSPSVIIFHGLNYLRMSENCQ